ncbi:hypothetical protein C8R44DRAFT_847923 [Mycena epipterygia]|nr:hypothetical protein C8R44DRAFT_847923 [Mycena epipterygia]
MSHILAFSLAALSLQYVAAETSLIIPFVDPQPISADIIGVDTALTRTTWALHQGAFTGTWTDPQGEFPGTATLVEGTDYASFTYVVAQPEATVTAGGVCSINGGIAVCTAAADDAIVTETDSVTAFGIEGGFTLAGAGAGGAAASGSATPSGSGSDSKSTAVSGSGPSGSTPTQSGASVRNSASALGGLAGLLLAYLFA